MGMYCPYSYERYPSGLNYPWVVPMPSKEEGSRRWQAIRKSMRQHNLDCLIVGSYSGYMPANNRLYYITNYIPIGAMGTYVVFPLDGDPRLCVNNVIGPQFIHIATEASWITDIVGSFHPHQDILRKVEQLKLQSTRLGIVDYINGSFPAFIFDFLRENLPQATFVDATQMLEEAMNEVSRSSEEELQMLKKACEIIDLSFEAVIEAFKPGVSECELWAAAEYAILKNGGWYPHNMFVTTSPGPVFPRGPASHRTLDPGDIAIFEINVTYGGVSPQICYALSLGSPMKEVKERFDFCESLYHFALGELEKQRTFLDVELELARRIHDIYCEPMTPQIHIYNMAINMPMDGKPQPGDYFTVHPNLCDQNYTRGAKFGDPVRITVDGKVERLQKTPARLHIVQI